MPLSECVLADVVGEQAHMCPDKEVLPLLIEKEVLALQNRCQC